MHVCYGGIKMAKGKHYNSKMSSEEYRSKKKANQAKLAVRRKE
jgi:hypothetical protein